MALPAGARRWRFGGPLGAAAAFVGCLALVTLPSARAFSDPGWALGLWLATALLWGGLWWRAAGPSKPAPSSDASVVSPPEVLWLGLAGAALTTWFWLRATLGVPGVLLGDLALSITLVLGGWAWPALLLAALHRRRSEGLRVQGRRRAGALLLVGFVAGSVGYLAHLALAEHLRDHPTLARALERPMESPLALSLTGGPRFLEPEPAWILLPPPSADEPDPVEVRLSGRIFPGIRGDLSQARQGTELLSCEPGVVRTEVGEDHRWYLHPVAPGAAIVAIRNRRARGWIGVQVPVDGRIVQSPAVDVTDRVVIEVGATRAAGGGFTERQQVRLRNRSEHPILGPLHLAVWTEAGAHAPVVGRTRAPEVLAAFGLEGRVEEGEGGTDPRGAEDAAEGEAGEGRGIFWVEVLPGDTFPRSPAPLFAPGASTTFELPVTGALEPDSDGARLRVFAVIDGC